MMLPSHKPVLARQPVPQKVSGNESLPGAILPYWPALRLTDRDCVGGTVIFQNQRIVHGDIRRALSKITDRIAARGHYIAQ
jgi:hypothetical protein